VISTPEKLLDTLANRSTRHAPEGMTYKCTVLPGSPSERVPNLLRCIMFWAMS